MYVFIRSCIALTRGVVKIIQTDPDSFFSFRSGTLSSRAVCPLHPRIPTSPPHLPPACHSLSLSLCLCPVDAPFVFPLAPLRCLRVILSSHCPVTLCRIRDCERSSISRPMISCVRDPRPETTIQRARGPICCCVRLGERREGSDSS